MNCNCSKRGNYLWGKDRVSMWDMDMEHIENCIPVARRNHMWDKVDELRQVLRIKYDDFLVTPTENIDETLF